MPRESRSASRCDVILRLLGELLFRTIARATGRLAARIEDADEEAEKERLRDEKDRLDKELEAAARVYYRHMFWVACPVGLAAIILGTFFPVQAVGAGLMFGGLGSLTAGCYSYWDEMGGWLRFGSLVVSLAVVLLLGTWRFRPRNTNPSRVA
ncbi:MAG: hypothetical protein WD069_13890 [Planctomycetales bacterium]